MVYDPSALNTESWFITGSVTYGTTIKQFSVTGCGVCAGAFPTYVGGTEAEVLGYFSDVYDYLPEFRAYLQELDARPVREVIRTPNASISRASFTISTTTGNTVSEIFGSSDNSTAVLHSAIDGRLGDVVQQLVGDPGFSTFHRMVARRAYGNIIPPEGIGDKKYVFMIPPLTGTSGQMQPYYDALEAAAVLGYNGVVMTMTTGTQYSTDMIWSGASIPSWPINAAAFRQKCTDLGLEFILGSFMAVMPNEGGYAPIDLRYAEAIPVKNQKFKVSSNSLVADDSEVRFQLPNLNWDGDPYWDGEHQWWGDWNLGTRYTYPYSQLLFGEWDGLPGTTTYDSWDAPIFVTREEGAILKWTTPETFTWQPNQVYETGKVILKNNRVFFAYVGGTSGAVEPNWSDSSLGINNSHPPVINNPLVIDKLVDGDVTWVYQAGSGEASGRTPLIGMESQGVIYPSSNQGYGRSTELVQHSYIDLAFDLKFQNFEATRIEITIYGYLADNTTAVNVCNDNVYLKSWWYQQGGGDGGTRKLTTTPGGTGYDMDWTRIHMPFNTIDMAHCSVVITFTDDNGSSIPKCGAQVWIKNITTKSAGLLNISRKDQINNDPTYGTPIYMRSLDGNTVYQEGVDFTGVGGGAVVDPYMNLSSLQLWHGGAEDDYHTEPPVPDMAIVSSSSLDGLPEGAQVLMDYYHVGFFGNEVKPCFAEPALYDFYEGYITQALAQWHPDAWFIETSEVRLLGWDKTCTDIGTVGEVLASHIDRLTALVKAADPGKPIYVWSDMWDETHNGTGREYLLATATDNSWAGLHSDTIILNWFKEIPSLDFFFEKGFTQVISSYYDNPDFVADEAALFAHAALLGPDMIRGAMYTTWSSPQNYTQLTNYFNMITSYENMITG